MIEEKKVVEEPSEKNSYIVKDSAPDRAFGLLSNMMNGGYKGMCVTRSNPLDVKKKYNLDIPIVWLSNQRTKDCITDTNIATLKIKIHDFIKRNNKSVVLMDRLDYLISVHGFNNVLNFIYSINEHVLMNSAILMINVNPSTLNPMELSLLEQELKELPKSKEELDSDLSDDLHEILGFVGNNDKVTFKKVSKEFSITKTTTRKRINNLSLKGLVIVKKNGRNKIVRITDEGKNLLLK